MVMNRKITFFAGALGCFVVSNFFAAEKSLLSNFNERQVVSFIPLSEGLMTLVPKILVTCKSAGWLSGEKIDKIMPIEYQWSLEGLMKHNHGIFISHSSPIQAASKLFLPVIINVNRDESIVKLKNFDSMESSPNVTEACRQKKAVFYPYKQGALISFLLATDVNIKLLEQNEDALRKLIDAAAEEVLQLRLPVIASAY
jgi:hypothetical protein